MFSLIDQTKISMTQLFLIEMFIIAEKPAVLYLKSENFDERKRK